MSYRNRIIFGTFSSIGGVLCIGVGFATGAVPAIVAGVGLLLTGLACYASTCKCQREAQPDPDDILGVLSWRLRRGL
jgi:uncharacterized membrane protein HdeD (DUF308 family)